MTTHYDPENPPLHSITTERIPYESWSLAGIEALPPGYVNVRIWSYDEVLGRDLYQLEPCPGVLHFESCVTQRVLQLADPDDNLFTEYGDPWDENPTVVDTTTVDKPHRYREFADPDWQKAYVAGGYLGTCSTGMVGALLAQKGFPDAIPRPEGHVDPEVDA